MTTTLTKKYKNKKKSTLKKRPKVGFELTLAEYKSLVENATVCDYTGMSFANAGENSRSIERVDASLPYRIDNCCVVTQKANSLKDLLEKGINGKVAVEDIPLLEKIKHTLENKTREELVAKYQLKSCQLKSDQLKPPSKETPMQNNTIEEDVSSNETLSKDNTSNSDITIAQDYITFCEKNTPCQVSFSKFKKLYLRKTCQWSGKTFQGSSKFASKVFAKVSQEKPFNDENIVVVCHSLKVIKENNIFSNKELNSFMKNI